MSINKAQEQLLKFAGDNRAAHCFSPGQLYVACSSVGTVKNRYMLAPNRKKKNVVYEAALQ
jgi:hypothetical protein